MAFVFNYIYGLNSSKKNTTLKITDFIYGLLENTPDQNATQEKLIYSLTLSIDFNRQQFYFQFDIERERDDDDALKFSFKANFGDHKVSVLKDKSTSSIKRGTADIIKQLKDGKQIEKIISAFVTALFLKKHTVKVTLNTFSDQHKPSNAALTLLKLFPLQTAPRIDQLSYAVNFRAILDKRRNGSVKRNQIAQEIKNQIYGLVEKALGCKDDTFMFPFSIYINYGRFNYDLENYAYSFSFDYKITKIEGQQLLFSTNFSRKMGGKNIEEELSGYWLNTGDLTTDHQYTGNVYVLLQMKHSNRLEEILEPFITNMLAAKVHKKDLDIVFSQNNTADTEMNAGQVFFDLFPVKKNSQFINYSSNKISYVAK